MEKNVLGPTLDGFNALSHQGLKRSRIDPHAESRFAHVDSLDYPAQEMGPETSANGFDLGEFRHGFG
jgi:hypothetical protein